MTACVVCKRGDSQPGTTTLTVERGAMTLVLKAVPARVCGNCGEAYFDEATTERIEGIVESVRIAGVEMAVKDYAAV